MSFSGFTPADFKVFDIDGFKPRMDAIRTRIRPKLEAMGRDLLPDVTRIAGDAAFAHVARHARRTVNPPDDTWVAFALDKRGYKQHCHFKVAVSRGGVRFLFEAGPEHAQKRRWAGALEAARLCPCRSRDVSGPGSPVPAHMISGLSCGRRRSCPMTPRSRHTAAR